MIPFVTIVHLHDKVEQNQPSDIYHDTGEKLKPLLFFSVEFWLPKGKLLQVAFDNIVLLKMPFKFLSPRGTHKNYCNCIGSYSNSQIEKYYVSLS